MKFYRYEREATSYTDGKTVYEIQLQTFFLIKETKKGYWIGSINFESEQNKNLLYGLDNTYEDSFKKWIPKESNSRFAYPTEKQALLNFKLRTERCIRILKRQLEDSETFLKMCEEGIYKKGLNNLFF